MGPGRRPRRRAARRSAAVPRPGGRSPHSRPALGSRRAAVPFPPHRAGPPGARRRAAHRLVLPPRCARHLLAVGPATGRPRRGDSGPARRPGPPAAEPAPHHEAPTDPRRRAVAAPARCRRLVLPPSAAQYGRHRPARRALPRRGPGPAFRPVRQRAALRRLPHRAPGAGRRHPAGRVPELPAGQPPDPRGADAVRPRGCAAACRADLARVLHRARGGRVDRVRRGSAVGRPPRRRARARRVGRAAARRAGRRVPRAGGGDAAAAGRVRERDLRAGAVRAARRVGLPPGRTDG